MGKTVKKFMLVHINHFIKFHNYKLLINLTDRLINEVLLVEKKLITKYKYGNNEKKGIS